MEYARDGQWTQDERSFRRAIELDPSDSAAYCDLTLYLLLPLGRIDEALSQMRIAEKTDPLSGIVQNTLGWALLSASRYEIANTRRQRRLSVWGERDWARGELTRQS
jgi:Tfp pilus assembly protein PilF